jgi:DNA-binding NtrC family response regulator
MTAPWKIVIASSDSNQLSTLAEILKRQELESICTPTVSQCRDVLSKEHVGVVFCDRNLSDGDHKDVIKAARSIGSIARIVVTSRQADWDEFLEAMRVGAFDVIASPCRPKDVEWMIVQAKRDDQRRAKQLLTSDTNRLAHRAERTAESPVKYFHQV